MSDFKQIILRSNLVIAFFVFRLLETLALQFQHSCLFEFPITTLPSWNKLLTCAYLLRISSVIKMEVFTIVHRFLILSEIIISKDIVRSQFYSSWTDLQSTSAIVIPITSLTVKCVNKNYLWMLIYLPFYRFLSITLHSFHPITAMVNLHNRV